MAVVTLGTGFGSLSLEMTLLSARPSCQAGHASTSRRGSGLVSCSRLDRPLLWGQGLVVTGGKPSGCFLLASGAGRILD